MTAENYSVIPEAAQRLSGNHNHRPSGSARPANMDSGLADFVRAPE
jgi:hypothetical protein